MNQSPPCCTANEEFRRNRVPPHVYPHGGVLCAVETCPGYHAKAKAINECATCEDYRSKYNVAIANNLVMKAQSITAQWGGHNRTAHR